jgi:REP element-mobilizing transposase RayT
VPKRKQEFLPGFEFVGDKEFGGSHRKGVRVTGNPKSARPFSTKRALHLVMRSKHAVGERSFLRAKFHGRIERVIRSLAAAKGIKVYRLAINGNHIHILLQATSRHAFPQYVRGISGIIARIVLGTERGTAGAPKRTKSEGAGTESVFAPSLPDRFWDARPYTRIVEWGRAFRSAAKYVVQNFLEAHGFIPYHPRKHKAQLVAAGT